MDLNQFQVSKRIVFKKMPIFFLKKTKQFSIQNHILYTSGGEPMARVGSSPSPSPHMRSPGTAARAGRSAGRSGNSCKVPFTITVFELGLA